MGEFVNFEMPSPKLIMGLVKRVEELEAFKRKQEESWMEATEKYSRNDAAEFCGITPIGINDARRKGRLKGVEKNEKEYEYRLIDLMEYLKKYRKTIYETKKRELQWKY